MNDKTAVTTREPFGKLDDIPLFSVNAGVPNDQALERAADLMLYAEHLAAADAFVNKSLESAIIQHLSETAKALVKAARRVEGEVGL
jgi:hypothetical protein